MCYTNIYIYRGIYHFEKLKMKKSLSPMTRHFRMLAMLAFVGLFFLKRKNQKKKRSVG